MQRQLCGRHGRCRNKGVRRAMGWRPADAAEQPAAPNPHSSPPDPHSAPSGAAAVVRGSEKRESDDTSDHTRGARRKARRGPRHETDP